jgi:hypothetical protein
MHDPEQTRRDFALFWETFWPSVGTAFGATMGGVIGVCAGGMFPGLMFAILGGLIGLETGEFVGAFVKGLFFPWVELLGAGRPGPAIGGVAGAGLLAIAATEMGAGIGATVFLGGCGFVCGAWLVVLVRLVADLSRVRRP